MQCAMLVYSVTGRTLDLPGWVDADHQTVPSLPVQRSKSITISLPKLISTSKLNHNLHYNQTYPKDNLAP